MELLLVGYPRRNNAIVTTLAIRVVLLLFKDMVSEGLEWHSTLDYLKEILLRVHKTVTFENGSPYFGIKVKT